MLKTASVKRARLDRGRVLHRLRATVLVLLPVALWVVVGFGARMLFHAAQGYS